MGSNKNVATHGGGILMLDGGNIECGRSSVTNQGKWVHSSRDKKGQI